MCVKDSVFTLLNDGGSGSKGGGGGGVVVGGGGGGDLLSRQVAINISSKELQ